MRIIMMPSCLYFIFIDASTSKHEEIFIVIGFSLEDKRGLSLGELIRPFCIMLLYRYLLHYGMLLHVMSPYLWLFSPILQGLHEEGECRQLEFWAGKRANIRDLFCTSPKVLKLHGSMFQNIYKILGERSTRGVPPTVHEGGGAPYPPGRAPCLIGPLGAL